MKKTVMLSVLTLSSALFANPQFYEETFVSLWADSVNLKRVGGAKRVFLTESISDGSGNASLKNYYGHALTKHMKFQPGFSLGASINRQKSTLELGFTKIARWNSALRKQAPASLSLPFNNNDPSFTNVDSVEMYYQTSLQNGEINYFGHLIPPKENDVSISWMGGVRYIEILENFDGLFFKGTFENDYSIKTKNHLIAPHVGGVFQWNPTAKVSLDFSLKIGFGLNRSHQSTEISNNLLGGALLHSDLPNRVRDESYSKNGVSFVTEPRILLEYQIFRNLDFHVGYRATYLKGVCLAAGQIVKDTGVKGRIKTGENLLFHGFEGGIRLVF